MRLDMLFRVYKLSILAPNRLSAIHLANSLFPVCLREAIPP